MSATGKRIAVAIGVLGLAVYAFMSVLEVRSTAEELGRHRDNLNEMAKKATQIDELSSAPRVAALEVESSDQILTRINAALEKAGLSGKLANQNPMEPQRIDKSDFALRKVDIKLNAATVQQIMAFCEALRDESTGSLVRDLNLYEPKVSGGRETWLSQMLLTQIIFSPKSES